MKKEEKEPVKPKNKRERTFKESEVLEFMYYFRMHATGLHFRSSYTKEWLDKWLKKSK